MYLPDGRGVNLAGSFCHLEFDSVCFWCRSCVSIFAICHSVVFCSTSDKLGKFIQNLESRWLLVCSLGAWHGTSLKVHLWGSTGTQPIYFVLWNCGIKWNLELNAEWQGDQIGAPLSGFIHRSLMGMDSVVTLSASEFCKLASKFASKWASELARCNSRGFLTPFLTKGQPQLIWPGPEVFCWAIIWSNTKTPNIAMSKQVKEQHILRWRTSISFVWPGPLVVIWMRKVGKTGGVVWVCSSDQCCAGRVEFDEFIKKLAQKVLPKQSLFVMASLFTVQEDDITTVCTFRIPSHVDLFWTKDSYFDLEQGRWTSWEDLMEVSSRIAALICSETVVPNKSAASTDEFSFWLDFMYWNHWTNTGNW